MKPGIDYIGVGGGALIFNDKGEVLLLKRTAKTKNQAGQWSKPGGSIEFGEKVEDAIIREIKEEVGVDIELTKFLNYVDDIMESDRQHWITFNFLGKVVGGKLENLEPEKHEEIKWFALNNLPEKLNKNTRESIEIYLKLKR